MTKPALHPIRTVLVLWISWTLLPGLAQPTAGEAEEPAAAAEPQPAVMLAEPPEPPEPPQQPEATEPPEPPEPGRPAVRIWSDLTVGEGEEVEQVVVVGGDARIDGKVRGDMVVVGGDATVNGQVEGAVVVPLGSLELGPKAVVEGNAVVVGGSIQADPSARIEGDRIEVPWEKVPVLGGLKNWIVHCLFYLRPLSLHWGWWWWAACASGGLYLLTALLFPRPIAASTAVLEAQPIGSFFVGILGFVLFCIASLLLAATGVGLLIVPFLCCGLVVSYLFGKVAVYECVGHRLGRHAAAAFENPVLSLLLGLVVLYLLYLIPIMGFVVWGLVVPLSVGAVLLALWRAFRSERARVPAPAPAAALAGGTIASASLAGPAALAVTNAVPPLIATSRGGLSPVEVELLPRAGFWIRFGATLLDLLLVGAVISILGLAPFFLLPWIAYHVGMWAWKGTTVGGVVFGLKLFRRDGRPVDVAIALVRSLSSILSALALFLGFFWAGWTREKVAWHDLIAGTIVVKMPKGVALF